MIRNVDSLLSVASFWNLSQMLQVDTAAQGLFVHDQLAQ